jgi:hypothetical protein
MKYHVYRCVPWRFVRENKTWRNAGALKAIKCTLFLRDSFEMTVCHLCYFTVGI